MNTSAFVTAIRIKLVENQYKTYFFLFAFCLVTASFSLEKIVGNLLAERLEAERKKDFIKAIEASLEERWKLHLSQIRSYAYWPEVWDLIKSKKTDKAYLNFQLDQAIDKQFDFFAIYLQPEKEFILKWSEGSNEKQVPDEKIISYFFYSHSGKEGQSNQLVFFNRKYYLVSVTSLADNMGKPMIDGIMLFAYELDHFIANTSSLFPIQMDILEGDEAFLNKYHSFSLEKLTIPGSKKVFLTYAFDSLRINLIRPYIVGILTLFSIFNLSLFSWILYKVKEQNS